MPRPKVTLGRLGLCLLPSLIVFAACEWLLTDAATLTHLKARAMETQASKIEVLCLGNSHALMGVAPAYFRRPGYNLASVAQSLTLDAQLLDRYLDAMPRLTTVVMNISYTTLYTRTADHTEAWRNHIYVREHGVAGDWIDPWDGISLQRYSRFLAYGVRESVSLIGDRLRTWRTTTEPARTDGGIFLPNTPHVDDPMAAEARVRQHEHDMHERHFVHNTAVLLSVAQKLHARGVRLVLLTQPVGREYRARMNPAWWDRSTQVARMLANTQPGVEYINLIDDPRFTVEDFFDSDHLNGRGAEKLSRLLDERLFEQPGVADRAPIRRP